MSIHHMVKNDGFRVWVTICMYVPLRVYHPRGEDSKWALKIEKPADRYYERYLPVDSFKFLDVHPDKLFRKEIIHDCVTSGAILHMNRKNPVNL